MNIRSMSNLWQRIIVGGFATLISTLAVYYSYDSILGVLLPLLVSGIAACAVWEYYAITKQKGCEPLVVIGVVATFLLCMVTYCVSVGACSEMLLPILLWLVFACIMGYYLAFAGSPILNTAATLFGIAYVAIPLLCIIAINYNFKDHAQDGRLWLLYLLLISKITDMAAYVVGKNIGANPLAPMISPSKTWEGAIGGTVAAILASIFFAFVANSSFPRSFVLSLPNSVLLGVTIALVSQFGDLTESALKRDGKVKDSNKLPGLGGMLDVTDSVIFTAPMLWIYLKLQ